MRAKVLLAFFVLASFAVPVMPRVAFAELSGGAQFSFTENTTEIGGVSTTTSTDTQTYHLSLGHNVPITRTIAFSADIQASTIEQSDGSRNTNIYPVFSLRFTPPKMYNFGFGYSRTEVAPTDRDHISSTNLNVTFSFPPTRWPSLLVSYNRSTSEDQDPPKSVDDVSSTVSIGSAYSFTMAGTPVSADYRFSYSEGENRIQDNTSESFTHRATVNLSRSFMDGRVTTSGNIGVSLNDSTTESTSGASRFERDVRPNGGLAVSSGTPLAVTLADEPELIDNDRNTAVAPQIDLNAANWNVGLRFAVAEEIHAIYLYIDTTAAEETNIINSLYNFSWSLYTSSDNITWTLVSALAPTYNSFFNRFEFSFSDTTARYFKLVNASGQGVQDINVTEIEALGFALATASDTYTSTVTRQFLWANLNYYPSDRLNFGLSFGIDRSDRKSDDSFGRVDTYTMYGLNVNYEAIPRYMTMGASYVANNWSSDNDSESTNESVTLSLGSRPLDTVNASLAVSHSENSLDGALQSESDVVSVGTFMKVYRGVDLNLSASNSITSNVQLDSESETMAYSWNLKLDPWKSVTALVNGGSSQTTTDDAGGGATSTSESLGMSVTYTPSRSLFLSTRLNFEPTASRTYAATWVPTSKIQMGLRYSESETTHGYGGNLSWQPIRRVNLHAGYDATVIDNVTSDKSETVFARASVYF